MDNLEKFKEAVAKTNNMVFFGGAGVSTESGIPDFRSVDGLYNQSYKYPPETMLSHTFYEKHPDEFFRFYRDKVLHTEAKPNAAHLKLAEWEREGKLKAVVTQNIDGLHQLAGSQKVLELHGSVLRNFCEKCFLSYDVQFIKDYDGVPTCTCGGRVKPDVVLYEEGLDQDILTQSVKAIAAADMLIIGGTSLVVYPAAGLIDYFGGSCLVVVNKAPTPRDKQADIVLQDSIGEVFSQV
jgi:NAD-dependent deacetylase